MAAHDDARDAARWRALLSSGRIRVLGTAGFDSRQRPQRDAKELHFGMEVWSRFPRPVDNERGIHILTEYADALRKK